MRTVRSSPRQRLVERHLSRYRLVLINYRGKDWFAQSYRGSVTIGNALVLTDQRLPITSFREGEHWTKPLELLIRKNDQYWERIWDQEDADAAYAMDEAIDVVGEEARDYWRETHTVSASRSGKDIKGT